MKNPSEQKFWGSSRILVSSFLIVIILGTILLSLPQAVHGDRLSLVDSLFTATSATCVTGLIVVDTGTKFTQFGQLVILLLIQLGGLGIMTFSTFFIFLIIGKFSIADRSVLQESLTQFPVKNILELLLTIFTFVILVEIIGAILLTLAFWDQMSLSDAIYHGLFHSISAFCNAGFSLNHDSFIQYQGNIAVNLILIILIILGGLGFIVLYELKQKIFNPLKKGTSAAFSFHSRIAIIISFILIIVGFFFIYLFESRNILSHQSPVNKVLFPLFQSITTRTAGFNSIDISILTNPTLFFIIMLMFIGASPGSCGGGIKTTTAGVIVSMLFARFKNQESVNIGYRRLPEVIVSRAVSVAIFSVTIVTIMTILLMTSEFGGVSHHNSRGLFLETLFEVVSAFGTVGLSTGITAGLSSMGKVIIIITMFIGRLGPLTVTLAIGKKEAPKYKYAEEKVLVG
ncbi:MAG: potassium transporter TrkG [bacterium]|nr:potassium transporter TrkG [bacterium]